MSSFRKLRQLSANERSLLTQALILLPLTFCGVYALGVSRWCRFLGQLASLPIALNRNSSHADTEAIAEAQAIARIVKIAAEQGIYQAKCLQQTLVLWCLLRRNHIESDIRFGARKAGGELQAHAWVEVSGIALNEDSDVCVHFSPLKSDVGLKREMPVVS